MKVFFLLFGKALQLLSLLAMPSAIWVGEFARNEAGAIGLFVVAIVVFGIGYFLTRLSTKL